jgi:hypothetical protein
VNRGVIRSLLQYVTLALLPPCVAADAKRIHDAAAPQPLQVRLALRQCERHRARCHFRLTERTPALMHSRERMRGARGSNLYADQHSSRGLGIVWC